jgi:AraC-like DNA-binding protein
MLNRDLARPPSLVDLSAALGCSAYHLSRVFREVNGYSLRSYLATARSRAAADAIARGARNLTELALRLGYADHSHFTNAFNKEWGTSPSRFRSMINGGGDVHRH